MKKQVAPKDSQAEFADFPITGLVPGWFFRVQEVSSGQFVADGTDLRGRLVSFQGSDPQRLLMRCLKPKG